MSENVTALDERIKPAFITDNDTGIKYELDFCKESIVFAENRGFELEKALTFPKTGVYDLFYYSFRMHNRSMPREKTDKILEKWGGMPDSLLKRLIYLYQQAQAHQTIQTDEEAEKNGSVTLEL
jgi:hypothetical protein